MDHKTHFSTMNKSSSERMIIVLSLSHEKQLGHTYADKETWWPKYKLNLWFELSVKFWHACVLTFTQSRCCCPCVQLGNGSVAGSRKRPSQGNYETEKDLCIQLFDQWSESDQVEFVEHLISHMCHYQHGHINSYLKPMLQRDFITALPGN